MQGNDHVHLVVNLVHGDGRIADTYRDWPRWRQWCLDVERRLGLTATSPANKTAPLRPTRGETEKAGRQRRSESSREYMRGIVRAAATRASSAEEFLALVREAGVRIEPRWGEAGHLAGYKVTVLADNSRTSPDARVWFSCSRLARDLSAPKLVARWASAPPPPPALPRGERDTLAIGSAERKAAVAHATTSITRASDVMTSPMASAEVGDGSAVEGIAHSTLDLLVAVANVVEGHSAGPITAAAHAFELAAATPYRVQPSRWSPVAAELRTAARRLARTGVVARVTNSGVAVVALLIALAGLVAEIAAWRERNGQRPQASAARRAADFLNADPAVQQYRRSMAARPSPGMPPSSPSEAPSDRRGQQRGRLERPRIGGFEPVRDPKQRRPR